jgi:hypothetical protein
MATLVKEPVDPRRIRRMPRQFGALDRRLVYSGLIGRLSLEEMGLYLLLVCAGDPQGLSFYSERRLGQLLGLDKESLCCARAGLEAKGLILFRYPFYQLLDLPEAP